MARQARVAPAGQTYHVMNRAAGRFVMMRADKDFLALERIIIQAHEREPLPILAYCLMGNHWHFVVRPRAEGQLARFFRWLTLTHAVRWRVAHRTVGYGHLYRGRYKSFLVQRGGRLLEVLRYVERNACRPVWWRARRLGAGAACGRDRGGLRNCGRFYATGPAAGRRGGRGM